ncbi:MAG TPA: hypothetical protein VFD76_12895 [Gemmatimonadales bacterium]|nr:hypothetical protein [Gemmatimonadales bacterium]HZI23417.1 hypothetical protein [Gemmatimonadales bacterium]
MTPVSLELRELPLTVCARVAGDGCVTHRLVAIPGRGGISSQAAGHSAAQFAQRAVQPVDVLLELEDAQLEARPRVTQRFGLVVEA